MSQRPDCAQFFFQLADLGCKLQYPPLRDGARMLLKLIPPDICTVDCLQSLFQNHARTSANGAALFEQGSQSLSALTFTSVESLFFGTSPSQVLYHLEVNMEFKIVVRGIMSSNLRYGIDC
jgi:ubiquitin carboxyl-terminal hydrolase 9/24